ncbi:MAG: hypothetical protein AB7S78_14215 [Candidatus Omnitrophota bacterium]
MEGGLLPEKKIGVLYSDQKEGRMRKSGNMNKWDFLVVVLICVTILALTVMGVFAQGPGKQNPDPFSILDFLWKLAIFFLGK